MTPPPATIWTIGHGDRPEDEFITTLREAGIRTLIDVRRFPGSRRHPQFNGDALAASLDGVGITYRHVVDLGGRRANEAGEERFDCIRVAAFRSYAARMGTPEYQHALTAALAEPAPCFMCSETLWWRCHRRLIAELLDARGMHVVHLLGPGKHHEHKAWAESDTRDGRLYVCGQLVA